jgi:hypothetical protein
MDASGAVPVRCPFEEESMRVVWIVLGIIAVLVGGLWTLQGLNLLGQSGGMNGDRMWAIIGPIVAVVGLLMLLVGVRKKRVDQ